MRFVFQPLECRVDLSCQEVDAELVRIVRIERRDGPEIRAKEGRNRDEHGGLA